jgi:hypothetical protein
VICILELSGHLFTVAPYTYTRAQTKGLVASAFKPVPAVTEFSATKHLDRALNLPHPTQLLTDAALNIAGVLGTS